MVELIVVLIMAFIAFHPEERKYVNKKKVYRERIAEAHRIMAEKAEREGYARQ